MKLKRIGSFLPCAGDQGGKIKFLQRVMRRQPPFHRSKFSLIGCCSLVLDLRPPSQP